MEEKKQFIVFLSDVKGGKKYHFLKKRSESVDVKMERKEATLRVEARHGNSSLDN